MMKYFAGIDGGGTKTHCIIGDHKGTMLSEGFSGGSNYQIVGEKAAARAIEESLHKAVQRLGIAPGDIEFTILGLSGADLDNDFRVLNDICRGIMEHPRFRVLNDTWIGLRAGAPDNWGIVTVCGTGSSCSGRNPEGREISLRNLNYELGNRGGGADIVRDAFHHAFRSEEGTGPKTPLEDELPLLFGFRHLNDMVHVLRCGDTGMDGNYRVPALVFQLAADGDPVCQNILLAMGRSLGEIAGGVARRLAMTGMDFHAVLVGSVFQGGNPLLVDEYTTTLHRAAPRAKIGIVKSRPAMGAYLLALEEHSRPA